MRASGALAFELTQAREARGASARDLRRAAQSGAAVRLRRGIYVHSDTWNTASDEVQYMSRIRAVAATRTTAEVVFSHESAALLWGLPRLGRWPRDVHVFSKSRRGAVRQNDIVWHRDSYSDREVCERDGLLVTTLERTLLDISRSRDLRAGVMALDLATKEYFLDAQDRTVSGVEIDQIRGRFDQMNGERGISVARASAHLSDNRSGSPGESLSRVQMHLLRFPPPRLQVRIPRSIGKGFDIPDFEWDGVLGEFDGKAKYTRDRFTGGRPIEEIVWEEKQREDRLRLATKKVMARWLWHDALRPAVLSRILVEAGLHPLSPARYRREFEQLRVRKH